jgi:amino acid transporter
MPIEIESRADAALVRAMGVRQLAAAVFNYTVGSGIFALPAFAYAQLGAAAPLGFFVTAFVMTLVALCFASAGSRVAVSGGPYAYTEIAFGPLAGAVTGVLFWLTCASSGAAVTVLFAASAARLVGAGDVTVFTTLLIVATIVVFCWLNARGVRIGARIVELGTAAKLIPLILFIVIGLFFIDPANLRWTEMPSAGAFARTAGILVFAFAGMEAAVTPGAEVREPARTVPRAVLISLAATTVLYVLVQIVAQGILGAGVQRDQATPLATAAGVVMGDFGRRSILVGTVISTLVWISGDLLAVPRSVFAFGRDGLLPRVFASVHPRYRTPHVAILTYGAVVAAFALSGTFERLAVLANLAILSLYFVVALATLVLQRRDVRTAGEPLRLPGGPTIPILAMIMIAAVFATTVTLNELLAVLGTMALGAVLHFLRVRRLSSILPAPE